MDIQEFPKWKYSATGAAQIVRDKFEEQDLGDGWFNTPWEAKGETPKPILPPGVDLENIQSAPLAEIRPMAVFQEYPKWVTPPGGEAVLVQSAAEEKALMGASEPPKKPDADDDKDGDDKDEDGDGDDKKPVLTVAKGPRGMFYVKDASGANVSPGFATEDEANAAKADMEANPQG